MKRSTQFILGLVIVATLCMGAVVEEAMRDWTSFKGVVVNTTTYDASYPLDVNGTARATTFSGAGTSLTGVVKSSDFTADSTVQVGTGSGTYAEESGATLRTSIGVGTGDSPQFAGLNLGSATATTLTGSAGVLSVEGKALAFMGRIDVTDPTYGADGTDAVDDTAAIQAAINAGRDKHAIVYFPPGTYTVVSTLTVYDGSQLMGDTKFQYTAGFGRDPNATTIDFNPTVADDDLFNYIYDTTAGVADPGVLFHTSIGGMYIVGNGATNSRYAISLNSVIYGNYYNMGIQGFQTPIMCNATIDNRFNNLMLSGTTSSVLYQTGTSTTDLWTQCTFNNSPIGIQTTVATVNIRFIGCLFEQLDTYGVNLVKETQSMEFTSCYCEDVPYANVATNAMFRVGFDGTTCSITNHITVNGGVYQGRSAGSIGSWMTIDDANSVMVSNTYVARYTEVFKGTASTLDTSICVTGMSGISWSNFYAGTAGKLTGVYPNGVINSGVYTQNAQFGNLNVSGASYFVGALSANSSIELGSVDTTLTRASAGDMNIEGNIAYRAGGTDVPATDGGTGVSAMADGGLVIGNAGGAVEVVAAGLTTQMLVGGGALTAPVWGTDLPTAVTIGSGYIYRAGGTDVADADLVDDHTLDAGGTTVYGSRAITVDTGGVFNIDIGSAVGDNFTLDTTKMVIKGDTGWVGFGVSPANQFNFEIPMVSADLISIWKNTSNTSGAGCANWLKVTNTTQGDAYHVYDISGTRWSVGMDNDDSNKFKIGANATVGTSTALTINISTLEVEHLAAATVRGITKLGSDTDNQSIGATGIRTFNGAAYDTNIQVGHATDTPLARSSAGYITVATKELTYTATVELTAANILDLADTPITLVAAQGADTVIEFVSAVLIHDAGTAYAEPSAPDDLVIQYATSGTDVSAEIDSTGFLDQVTDEVRLILPAWTATTDLVPDKNHALQLFNTGADLTTGDGTMTVKITYRVHTLGL